ncbi:hypothetical protein BJF93_19395 [Xaviernesmea oryzae]|uniref:Head-tail adaptor protein n=1 Tax=Xaviernesmea oryzae TaxID=464029 RepID=A0A1Q9B1G7_9HYPH|nr:head-tail adaptor protein [Xaviernesmea oryzae]OLP61852.1 hypothetical protein BJF93_19395 [Xaviernesmea oryzae]SEL75378.1 head-tail adaptor [Xaviernesmea oryzae]
MLADLDPGALSTRLTLDLPIETADGQGGVSITYRSVGQAWGRIEPLPVHGSAEDDDARATHRIWLRHRTDLKAGMRFGFGSRSFLLVSAGDPDETRRLIVARVCEVTR